MNKKKVVIVDSSTFKNVDGEAVRLESAISRYKNEHLSKYADKIDWILAGINDIPSNIDHTFYYMGGISEDVAKAKELNVSVGMVSLVNLRNRIKAKLNIDPDLIIYNSSNISDWDDFDTILNTSDATFQESIRNKIIMVNNNCRIYSMIIPKIINMLGLDNMST